LIVGQSDWAETELREKVAVGRAARIFSSCEQAFPRGNNQANLPRGVATSANAFYEACNSSVIIVNRANGAGPKVVEKATSAASRPRAMTMQPIQTTHLNPRG
jgi:hypothetical protein